MTTKDTIIQQLNDKLATAIEQEKKEVVSSLFVPAPQEDEKEENDQAD